MMKGGHGQTNQLHDINWGALDHASCVPQFISCNCYVCVCVCMVYKHVYDTITLTLIKDLAIALLSISAALKVTLVI